MRFWTCLSVCVALCLSAAAATTLRSNTHVAVDPQPNPDAFHSRRIVDPAHLEFVCSPHSPYRVRYDENETKSCLKTWVVHAMSDRERKEFITAALTQSHNGPEKSKRKYVTVICEDPDMVREEKPCEDVKDDHKISQIDLTDRVPAHYRVVTTQPLRIKWLSTKAEYKSYLKPNMVVINLVVHNATHTIDDAYAGLHRAVRNVIDNLLLSYNQLVTSQYQTLPPKMKAVLERGLSTIAPLYKRRVFRPYKKFVKERVTSATKVNLEQLRRIQTEATTIAAEREIDADFLASIKRLQHEAIKERDEGARLLVNEEVDSLKNMLPSVVRQLLIKAANNPNGSEQEGQ